MSADLSKKCYSRNDALEIVLGDMPLKSVFPKTRLMGKVCQKHMDSKEQKKAKRPVYKMGLFVWEKPHIPVVDQFEMWQAIS